MVFYSRDAKISPPRSLRNLFVSGYSKTPDWYKTLAHRILTLLNGSHYTVNIYINGDKLFFIAAIESLASTSWACVRCLTQEVQVGVPQAQFEETSWPPCVSISAVMTFCFEQGCSEGGERCWTHQWLMCVEKRTWLGGGPEETVSSWSTNGSWRKWSSCMRWVIKTSDLTCPSCPCS